MPWPAERRSPIRQHLHRITRHRLVNDRILRFDDVADRLTTQTGQATVSGNITAALRDLLDPVVLALVPQIIAHDEIRRRIATDQPGLPLLSDAAAVVENYLAREQQQGRIAATVDVGTTALSVIATAHLLLADELGALPTTDAVREVIGSILVALNAIHIPQTIEPGNSRTLTCRRPCAAR